MSSLLLAPSFCSCSNLPVINSAAFKRPSSPSSLSRFYPQRGCHGFPSLTSRRHDRRRCCLIVNSNGQPVPPAGPSNSSPLGLGRICWIAGMVVTILLPFLKSKWGPLLFYKKEVDTVMQRAEDTVEVLEKMAEVVEKVAEDLAEELPQGHLKNTAMLVERMAEEVAKDAHLIDAAIDKVQELEEKAEKYMKSSRKASKRNEDDKTNNIEEA